MSLPAPKPLSVSTSPSQGPAAARAATQDAQIAQLVQQNRTLEHTLTELRNQLQAEKARGVDAVNQIKVRWKSESKEWRDGCDVLQAEHRLAHLGTRVALEHERGLRSEDNEALTREKTARLLREYKLTLFQVRETDLVVQMATLEDELEIQREEFVEVLTQREAEIAQLNAKLSKSETRRQERAEELGDFAQARKESETELTTLRASSSSHAKQVERLNLQLESLRTQNATIETRNRELQHQVDKWQSLEGKGEKEVEALRKRRIELEVRVKELEVSLKETRGLEKKVGKLESSLLETQEQVEQGQQDISEAQAEAEQAQKQVAKLERQVGKLQSALEAEKTRSAGALEKEREKARNSSKAPSSKARPRAPSVIDEVSEGSENEVIEQAPIKPQSRSQKPASARSNRPNAKGKGKEKVVPEPSELELETQRDKGKGKGKGKEQERPNEALAIEDEAQFEETEEEVHPPIKKRSRPQEEDSDIEEVPPPKKPQSKAGRSKAGETGRDVAKKPRSRAGKAGEVDGDEERPKKPARNKPASANGGAAKPPSARVDAADDQEEGEDPPQKKKKRKLNVTGGTNVFGGPAGFTWDQDGTGDLGIPSVLSPVKEGQPVPPRSGSSSLLGGWKMPWKS